MSEAATTPPLAPLTEGASAEEVLDRFIEAMFERGIELYAEQEEAMLELFDGRHVILNTPTGSGKSLVAAALIFKTLCEGERAVYTCPIKALVNEKFLALCRDHGPENVGLMTGDASVNVDAPILCCTAEILANIALVGGSRAEIVAVVMDEFHYYGDASRGTAWQLPLLLMWETQFLLMSATLPDTAFFERELEKLSERKAVTVKSDERPVPLEFIYSEETLAEQLDTMVSEGKAPVYLVYFTQRSASEAAQSLVSLNATTREERDIIGKEIADAKFNSPYGKELKRCLRHGIGIHHAGLLPKYRLLVESLAQKGLLKVICGTDTLGVGINVPIRSVVFTQLWKYDGRKSAILSVRDFRQISGRAGRRGFDDRGYVVAMAPEHVIENRRAAAKAASDPKKKKKLVKKGPQPGQVNWDDKTFTKLQTAPNEGLPPVFEVGTGLLLQVLSRDEDGCAVMKKLISDSHTTPHRKRLLRRRSWQLFRALIDRGIVDFVEPSPTGRKLLVNIELQEDFSLHQALSLYLLDTLPLLEEDSDDYPLEMLTLCEAIVEDPAMILRKQLDRIKNDEVGRMKAEGIPYEERMEKLDTLEYPKPMREFLYDSFNTFKSEHPWVDDENVKPKSIAREMFERYMSFADYTKMYGLQRSEGLLLRHLAQSYKVLAQTVPDVFKTEVVFEMEDYLRTLIEQTDSSLLDEWERLRDPEFVASDAADAASVKAVDITRDRKAFQRLVRARLFAILLAVRSGEWEDAVEMIDQEAPAPEELKSVFDAYFDGRGEFRLDPEGRNLKHSYFDEDEDAGELRVAQILVDTEELNDWELRFRVDLRASKEASRPVLKWAGLGAVVDSA